MEFGSLFDHWGTAKESSWRLKALLLAGAVLVAVLQASVKVLKFIQAAFGSRCSDMNSGVDDVCDICCFGLVETRHVAAFWII